jgi:SAM-dependent methyltransferase
VEWKFQFDDNDFDGLLEAMFGGAAKYLNKEHHPSGTADPFVGSYGCIHFAPAHFVRDLETLNLFYNKTSRKFLDVGCGVGQKVYLAFKYKFDAYGIEIRPAYADVAQQLLIRYLWNMPQIDLTNRIIVADAVQFDFKDFDVIYFYRPMWDNKLEAQLERQIAKTAKIGAIVLAKNPGPLFGDFSRLKWYGWKAMEYQNLQYFERVDLGPLPFNNDDKRHLLLADDWDEIQGSGLWRSSKRSAKLYPLDAAWELYAQAAQKTL